MVVRFCSVVVVLLCVLSLLPMCKSLPDGSVVIDWVQVNQAISTGMQLWDQVEARRAAREAAEAANRPADAGIEGQLEQAALTALLRYLDGLAPGVRAEVVKRLPVQAVRSLQKARGASMLHTDGVAIVAPGAT